MTKNVAPEVHELAVGETRNGAYSFKGELDSGELLTGTPLVIDNDATGDLTITNKAVNTKALVISNDQNVLVGQAVQYSVSGHLVGKEYKLKITATTDATPAQTLIEYAIFKGVDPC